jgi:hypothetical protein
VLLRETVDRALPIEIGRETAFHSARFRHFSRVFAAGSHAQNRAAHASVSNLRGVAVNLTIKARSSLSAFSQHQLRSDIEADGLFAAPIKYPEAVLI